jgi:hypothetical protein
MVGSHKQMASRQSPPSRKKNIRVRCDGLTCQTFVRRNALKVSMQIHKVMPVEV